MKAGDAGEAATSGARHLSIRSVLTAAAITCLLGCSAKAPPPSSSITATFDQGGHHPATAVVTGIASVSCSDGAGSQGTAIDCLIVAPGYVGEVPLRKSVKTTGAGTVMLTCSGQGKCTAVVAQEPN
jgi:hypothetical protein